MKTKQTMVAVMAIIAGVVATGCGSSKKAQTVSVTDARAVKAQLQDVPEIEISTPCSGEEFYSTKEFIRSTAVGESMDQQMAKRMVRSAALEDLGTKIRVAVNALISDYYKSTKRAMTEDLKRRFEGGTDLVVQEYISGYRTLCEKFTRKGSNYKCYMAIEIGTDELSKPIYEQLSDDDILRVDYDYEKFREKFNEAMSKADGNR
ncbi:MAG: hypothetical protein LBE04_01585 [Prevotellaceae bacterium]|jgi:hypothetical protein|nr:hypothetical protein [Prevotellaceae bacterium]